jgi:hypothetical protein
MKDHYLLDQKLKRKKDKLESLVDFEKILIAKIEKDEKDKTKDKVNNL